MRAVAVACLALAVIAAALVAGRTQRFPPQAAQPPGSTLPTAGRPPAQLPTLCRPLRATVTGTVSDGDLNELSGLAVSRRQPRIVYAHEDSGAEPDLWTLRTDGSVIGRTRVPGAEAIDWEDMAIGIGPGAATSLYFADIGDNPESRDLITVYRVPEPDLGGPIAAAERFVLRYPDGAHNAEALVVDPLRGDLVVITKRATGADVYALAGAARRRAPQQPAVLTKIGTLDLGFVTGADISADGRSVAVRSYTSVLVWQRRGREPLRATLRRRPCRPELSLNERQGEAIALHPSGRSIYTASEGTPVAMQRFAPTVRPGR